MHYSDEIPTFIVDLPLHIPGLTASDAEGNPFIYLNARLTWNQIKNTYKHEMEHIRNNDLFNNVPSILAEIFAQMRADENDLEDAG